jgi:hypothetical protein
MLARDGVTIVNNVDEFGSEWQVREDEPMLFRSLRNSAKNLLVAI